jgi:hypothetical protein
MLHHSVIPTVIEKKDGKGMPVVFDIAFRKRSTGERVEESGAQCLSSHFEPRTYNVKFASGEIRKVRHLSIVRINNERIYL